MQAGAACSGCAGPVRWLTLRLGPLPVGTVGKDVVRTPLLVPGPVVLSPGGLLRYAVWLCMLAPGPGRSHMQRAMPANSQRSPSIGCRAGRLAVCAAPCNRRVRNSAPCAGCIVPAAQFLGVVRVVPSFKFPPKMLHGIGGAHGANAGIVLFYFL